MMVQVGGIISSQIYRADDAKSGYARGNRILLGLSVYNIVFTVGVKCASIPRLFACSEPLCPPSD